MAFTADTFSGVGALMEGDARRRQADDQFRQQMAYNLSGREQQGRQFAAQLEAERQQNTLANAVHQRNLDLQQKRLDYQMDPTKSGISAAERFNMEKGTAGNLAQAGNGENDPDWWTKTFPWMDPNTAIVHAETNRQARAQVGGEYNAEDFAARAGRMLPHFQNSLAAAAQPALTKAPFYDTEESWLNPDRTFQYINPFTYINRWLGTSSPDTSWVAPFQQRAAGLRGAVDAAIKAGQIVPQPGGGYATAMPQPRWMQAPAAPTANVPTATTPQTNALIGAVSPMQPSVLQTNRPAMQGYRIGIKYGGLTYLGGDPNVETNWSK